MAAINNGNGTNVTVFSVNVAQQKAAIEAEYKALIAGINSELADVTSITVLNVVYTKQALVDKFQGRIDAAEKTKTARTALHALVAAEQDIALDVGPIRMGFKQFVQGRYGATSPELQKFGFTPNKVPQRPVASKQSSIAKSAATRQARLSVGKKQRLKITAPPTPTAAAPADAPPATAAPTAPAEGTTPAAPVATPAAAPSPAAAKPSPSGSNS
jgi:hypothetical protein